MSTEDIKNAAESLKDKAQARSERIEGEIRENLGEMDNDPEAIEHGKAKQAKADALDKEAESK